MLSREKQAIRAANRIFRVRSRDLDELLTVLVEELLKLEGLFVKFAQMLILNQKFAEAIPKKLYRRVYDRVDVNEIYGLDDYFDSTDLARIKKHFRYISPQPAFAGSFAAVFEGQLLSGDLVIIKVLRPNIHKSLVKDLKLLKYISKPVTLFNEEIKFALRNTLSNFRTATLQEIDYLQEIKNATQLEETFRENKYIYIPKTFKDLSDSKYIVQEKIEGVWLSEIVSASFKGERAINYVKDKTGSDIKTQLFYLGQESLYKTLTGNIVHGDPHPGNIVLMSGNRIGLIDFGITALPVDNRLALYEYIKEQINGMEGKTDIAKLMITIMRFHANYLYRAITKLGEIYQRPLLGEMYDLLTRELVNFQDQINNETFEGSDYSNALSSNINENNRFGLIPKLDNPLTQKAFIALWRANQDLDFEDVTHQVFVATVRQVEENNDFVSWQEESMSVDGAFQVISEWLSHIAEKDSKLFMQIQELFKAKTT